MTELLLSSPRSRFITGAFVGKKFKIRQATLSDKKVLVSRFYLADGPLLIDLTLAFYTGSKVVEVSGLFEYGGIARSNVWGIGRAPMVRFEVSLGITIGGITTTVSYMFELSVKNRMQPTVLKFTQFYSKTIKGRAHLLRFGNFRSSVRGPVSWARSLAANSIVAQSAKEEHERSLIPEKWLQSDSSEQTQ